MSSVHKRDATSYRVMFRHAGKQRSLTFNSEAAAEKWRKLLDALGWDEAKKWLDQSEATDEATLLTYCHSYIEHLTGVTTGTKTTYKRYLKNHFAEIGLKPLSSIDANTVSKWLNALADKGLSGKSIANLHAFLSGALETAVRDDLIPKNASKGLRLPKTHSVAQEMVFLTQGEFYDLLPLIDEFYHPLVLTLVGTGMRFGEATALTVADVNFTTNSIRINKAWKMTGGTKRELGVPKTKRSNRTVAFPNQVAEALKPSCEGRRRDALIFTNRHGKVLAHNVFHPVWFKASGAFAETSGIHPRIHDLRHTFASWAISSGVPLPVIQRQLGHESITTTVDRYGHLMRSDFEALATSIGSFLPDSKKAITRA